MSLLVAATDSASAATVYEACAALGLAPPGLTEAEDAGLVTVIGDRIEFRHPLVRSAVYRSGARADRYRVHAALAKATDPGRASVELPTDLVIGDRLAADAEHRALDGVEVPEGWMGLDIGPRSAAAYAEVIAGAGTVLWNGPMGAFELLPFAATSSAGSSLIP